MQITKIAKIGKEDKFAVFIDDVLKIFLSGQSILDNNLSIGQEITDERVSELTNLSNVDQLFLKALKYISLRIRSEGEVNQYLKRKGASTDQQKAVITRLKKLDLINDEKFTQAFIHDRLMVTPKSKRKISYELKKKFIAENIIENSLSNDLISDEDSLDKLVVIKRKQSKYQDDLKLMQYLVRNGFNYGDVKKALDKDPES
ncbi:MAG: RecX family transcriptional regulator [Candidatus Saccharibacteria bacterium]